MHPSELATYRADLARIELRIWFFEWMQKSAWEWDAVYFEGLLTARDNYLAVVEELSRTK